MKTDSKDLRSRLQSRLDNGHYRSAVMMIRRYFGNDKTDQVFQQHSIVFGKELIRQLQTYLQSSSTPMSIPLWLKNENTSERIRQVQKNEAGYYYCSKQGTDFQDDDGSFASIKLVDSDGFLRIFDLLAQKDDQSMTVARLKETVNRLVEQQHPQRAIDLIYDHYGTRFNNELVNRGYTDHDSTLQMIVEDSQSLINQWSYRNIDSNRLQPLFHMIDTLKENGAPYWNYRRYDNHLEPITTKKLQAIIDTLHE